MSLVSEHRVSRRYFAVGAAAFTLVLFALLALTTRAQAAELLYWDNYSAEPSSISFANIDGSGGGALNLTGAVVDDPEGMTFDSTTGRLYVASSSGGPGGKGEIVFVNVDGSGAGVLSAPGAEINEPYGVAIDPVTRIIYWTNNEGGPAGKGSIGYAKLDGSGGGLLNTTGVAVEDPYKLAVDPATGRVYWANTENTPNSVGFANLNNTGGGGTLDLTGAPTFEGLNAMAVAAGRVYWLESGNKRISFANVNGGGGGEINLASATFTNPYGLAIDPTAAKIYWANFGLGETRAGAIGFSGLAGEGPGAISPATAPVDGPQDPVILKSPTGTAAPGITRSTKTRSQLTCSPGGWATDFAGSFVYQAPRTLAYQWTQNGVAIPGATATTLEATAPGSYACVVTAANQAGTASQTSAPVKVKAAKVKLTAKKKARVKPGGVATFKVKAVNQGDLKSRNARVCVKVPNKAKKDLKAKPKCKPFGKVKAGGKDTAKLRIKVGESAGGTYKVTFQVKGSAGKAAKAKIIVG